MISAGTDAALSFIVANSVDDTSFGGFAVALTVFSVAIGISRAVATSPLGIRFSDVSAPEYRAASGAAIGTAVTLGMVGGIGSLAAAALVGGVAGQALLALSVMLLAQGAWGFAIAFWAVIPIWMVRVLREAAATTRRYGRPRRDAGPGRPAVGAAPGAPP